MGLISRQLTRWTWLLVAMLLVAAVVDGASLWRRTQWNQLIATGVVPPAAPVAELRFARAHAQAASGAMEAALDGYRRLQGDTPLGLAARFNSANLLMRQAIEVQASAQPGQAIALIELAKEGYRDVLRSEPQHWPARYNLERAQRLWPDPEEIEVEPALAPRQRERSASTTRGMAPGLP